MTERAGAMIDAVMQYASGNAYGDEYILREFLETTMDLAELVMYMAMFDYALRKIPGVMPGGTEGGGDVGSEGEAGGNGGGERGNGGTGNGSGGTSDGGSGGTGSGNGGTGEGGTGGSGGVGTGEGTGTGGSPGGGGNGGSNTLDIDELVVRDSKYLDVDGNVDWEKWAPNFGRVPGTIKENQTIIEGTVVDRYGNQYGRYVSPVGVPYEQRALPYIENPKAYHKYEVLKPIKNVTISEIAPAFEQEGGGIQYELPNTIDKLIKLQILKEIN